MCENENKMISRVNGCVTDVKCTRMILIEGKIIGSINVGSRLVVSMILLDMY